ncbi:RNA-directed DNA polymerase, eukaryota, reverse transcriptase zinc-binding domain protein, partial [Tanacetum coccineum]
MYHNQQAFLISIFITTSGSPTFPIISLILKFPDANALFLPYIVSDHSPVVVRFPFIYEKKKNAFRFTNYIANKEDFIPTVAAGWEYEALNDYNEAANDEESFLFQKEKVEWISKRDKNNQFFHKIIKSRRQANKIISICDDNDNRLEGNLMEEQFVNHFKKFLGAGHVTNDLMNFEGVFGTKLKFFTTGKLLGKLNATINSLIPKRKGYFPSGSGLRQGDHMSPCLFTLVMEVFTLLMAKNVQKNQKFKFHTGCKELKLTHLCFADDLLVVCNGDVESVKVIKSTMLEFSGMPGLIPNMEKSTVFFKNVKNETKTKILDILPFTVRKLPVKYLSYACGLKLIASVLSSLNFYWATVFKIPKSMVKDIDKILKGFLWCNGKSREEKQRLPGKMFAILKVK